jgi:hypothetical protein
VCVYTMYIYLKQWDGVVQQADISIITGLLCGDIFLPPLPRGCCMGGGLSPLMERLLYMKVVLRRGKGVYSLQGERVLIPSCIRQAQYKVHSFSGGLSKKISFFLCPREIPSVLGKAGQS